MKRIFRQVCYTAVIMMLFLGAVTVSATVPDAGQTIWEQHDETSTTGINHTFWDLFLRKYVIRDHASGINRFKYADVSENDKQALDLYIQKMEKMKISSLRRDEQLAFWINLYNALTIRVVLDEYPIKSIRDISFGLFTTGPWKKKLVTIEGEKLSLHDIEHTILGTVWHDNKIHYALNCASLGCPNLQPVAFTAQNISALFNRGALEYINHPRGVSVQGDTVMLSSIYKRDKEDFGGSIENILTHIGQYANDELKKSVNQTYAQYRKIDYEYDWRLNDQ